VVVFFICAGVVIGALGMRQRSAPRITAAEADKRVAQGEAAAARTQAARNQEKYKSARDAYRLADTRFELARLAGSLRQFVSALGPEPPVETMDGLTKRQLCRIDSLRSYVDRYDSSLGSLLGTRRGELQSVLHPEYGSSASSPDEVRTVAAAHGSIALQTAGQLDTWIKQHQPKPPVD